MSKKLLIIDSYGLIFRAYHAFPFLSTSDGKPTNAVFGFLQMLLSILDKHKPDYLLCALDTDKPTFRHKLSSDYKATRKEIDNELNIQIPEIINILNQLNIPTTSSDGYEADDVIGSFAKQNETNADEIKILTGDRDLLQLISPKIHVLMPGRFFSEVNEYDSEKFKEKFGIEVDEYILYKTLTGDASDNIKGVPGVGPKSAISIIEKYKSLPSILANLDDLPPRIAAAIEENQNLLDNYLELCTIKTDLELNFSFEETAISQIHGHKLRKIIEQFEFKSLQKRAAKLVDDFEAKYGGFGSLFDESSNDGEAIIEESIAEKVNFFQQTAYIFVTATGFKIGNGKEFVHIAKDEIYNFIILNNLEKLIGFDLKKVARTLLEQEFENLNKLKLFDLKLAWYLAKSDLTFDKVEELLRYTRLNSYVNLYEKSVDEIDKNEIKELFEIESKLIAVLAKMEFHGINCDKTELENLKTKYRDIIDETKSEIFKVVGYEFNPASTKELAHVLFDVLKLPPLKKTKTGYSTDDNTLTQLEHMHEIIPLIKKFRLYSKMRSTYVIGLEESISKDGKIHSTFNQMTVATGRLSSIDPNLQNLPTTEIIGEEIRNVFKPEPGFVFLSMDYSQIELRILAFVTNDAEMVKAFNNDEDIHIYTARQIFGKEEISKEERNFAKVINFGIVFGMEPYGLAQALKIDQARAKTFIEAYFGKFSGVKTYFDRIKHQLDEKGYVETFMKRKRYFASWSKLSGFQKRAFFREAINMPIQGGESELVKMAMVKIDDYFYQNKINGRILLQIHDELIIELEESKETEKICTKLKEIMNSIYDIQVPLKVSSTIGKSLNLK